MAGNGGVAANKPPIPTSTVKVAGNTEIKKTDEMVFQELKNKINDALEIRPDASYLILVKAGALTKVDKDVFISLWQRNFRTGLLIFEVEDPQNDCRVLELAR